MIFDLGHGQFYHTECSGASYLLLTLGVGEVELTLFVMLPLSECRGVAPTIIALRQKRGQVRHRRGEVKTKVRRNEER